MSPALRIGGFAAVLAVVFAAAALAGNEINPSVEDTPVHQEDTETMNGHTKASKDGRGQGHEAPVTDALPGLAVAQGGLRLVPERTSVDPATSATYRFRIVDPRGETIRDFDVEHERRMHLIVVRRDFAGFQHLHPHQLADGTWEVEADLSRAGTYRVFADFSSDGESLTLGADLFVAGAFEPQPLAPVATTASAEDGYEVTISSAKPQVGVSTPVTFTVSRDGRVVDSVEPYLGADGHLVALREHDQAFLHTHPEGEAGGSGPIRFEVSYPTAGRYRLFLQFRHRGEVRTVEFTQEVDVDTAAKAPNGGASSSEHGEEVSHGH